MSTNFEPAVSAMPYSFLIVPSMSFPDRLAGTRKAKAYSQSRLAELTGISPIQIRRYEAGSTQPTLEALRRLAVALSVTIDYLAFDQNERGPDDDLRLEFEAMTQFTPEERRTAKAMLKGLILKHEAERWPTAPESETSVTPVAQPARITPLRIRRKTPAGTVPS